MQALLHVHLHAATHDLGPMKSLQYTNPAMCPLLAFAKCSVYCAPDEKAYTSILSPFHNRTGGTLELHTFQPGVALETAMAELQAAQQQLAGGRGRRRRGSLGTSLGRLGSQQPTEGDEGAPDGQQETSGMEVRCCRLLPRGLSVCCCTRPGVHSVPWSKGAAKLHAPPWATGATWTAPRQPMS